MSSNTSARRPVGSSLGEGSVLEVLEEPDDVGVRRELLERLDLAQALDLGSSEAPGRGCRSGSSCT